MLENIKNAVVFKVNDSKAASEWLCNHLNFCPASENSSVLNLGDCCICLCDKDRDVDVQVGEDGYYVGLEHLALRTWDIQKAFSYYSEKGLTVQSEPCFNPNIWGTGMMFFNLRCPFGASLEICQRLDLDSPKDTRPLLDGLDHIGLPVENIEDADAFYSDLGFRLDSKAFIHRQDGKKIICEMMSRCGLTIELYEFCDMKHELYRDQTFAGLILYGDQPVKNKSTDKCHIDIDGTNQAISFIIGPYGEHLYFGADS